MARRADYPDPFRILLRANRVVALAVLWAALVACVIGALAFDITDWLNAWQSVSFHLPSSAASI